MKMYNREQLINELIEAIPSFLPSWAEYQKYNKSWNEDIYLSLAEIVHFVVDNLDAANSQNEFKELFSRLELLFIEADGISKESLATGFIETLENNLGQDSTKTKKIYDLMGKKTRNYFDPITKVGADELNH